MGTENSGDLFAIHRLALPARTASASWVKAYPKLISLLISGSTNPAEPFGITEFWKVHKAGHCPFK